MILVTGGTGLVGSHLLFQLTQEELQVRAIYRNENTLETVLKIFGFYTKSPQQYFDKIHWVKAALNDLSSLSLAFDGVSRVYHCAAMISFDPNDYLQLKAANEIGTANIVNMSIAKKVKKICYVSSIAAIGKSPDKTLVTENDEWRRNSVNPYALTKFRAEMEVWRGTQEGVPAVIVNPGVILGPGFWDRGSGKLFRFASKSTGYYTPGGTGFVDINDVVSMMVSLMKSDIENERFIAVSENLTYREILTKISGAMDLKLPGSELKIWQLNLFWRLDWFWHLISRQKRRLTRAQVASMKSRKIYDNQKAKNAFGFVYKNLDDSIEFCSGKFMEDYLSPSQQQISS